MTTIKSTETLKQSVATKTTSAKGGTPENGTSMVEKGTCEVKFVIDDQSSLVIGADNMNVLVPSKNLPSSGRLSGNAGHVLHHKKHGLLFGRKSNNLSPLYYVSLAALNSNNDKLEFSASDTAMATLKKVGTTGRLFDLLGEVHGKSKSKIVIGKREVLLGRKELGKIMTDLGVDCSLSGASDSPKTLSDMRSVYQDNNKNFNGIVGVELDTETRQWMESSFLLPHSATASSTASSAAEGSEIYLLINLGRNGQITLINPIFGTVIECDDSYLSNVKFTRFIGLGEENLKKIDLVLKSGMRLSSAEELGLTNIEGNLLDRNGIKSVSSNRTNTVISLAELNHNPDSIGRFNFILHSEAGKLESIDCEVYDVNGRRVSDSGKYRTMRTSNKVPSYVNLSQLIRLVAKENGVKKTAGSGGFKKVKGRETAEYNLRYFVDTTLRSLSGQKGGLFLTKNRWVKKNNAVTFDKEETLQVLRVFAPKTVRGIVDFNSVEMDKLLTEIHSKYSSNRDFSLTLARATVALKDEVKDLGCAKWCQDAINAYRSEYGLDAVPSLKIAGEPRASVAGLNESRNDEQEAAQSSGKQATLTNLGESSGNNVSRKGEASNAKAAEIANDKKKDTSLGNSSNSGIKIG